MHLLYDRSSYYATFTKTAYGQIAYGSDPVSVPYRARIFRLQNTDHFTSDPVLPLYAPLRGIIRPCLRKKPRLLSPSKRTENFYVLHKNLCDLFRWGYLSYGMLCNYLKSLH